MARILTGAIALALVGGALFFFFILPARVDASLNKVAPHEPYEISEGAKTFHASLRLADLHDDALLWDRRGDILSMEESLRRHGRR